MTRLQRLQSLPLRYVSLLNHLRHLPSSKLPSTEQPNATTVTERLTILTKTLLTTASAAAVMPHKLLLSSSARFARYAIMIIWTPWPSFYSCNKNVIHKHKLYQRLELLLATLASCPSLQALCPNCVWCVREPGIGQSRGRSIFRSSVLKIWVFH